MEKERLVAASGSEYTAACEQTATRIERLVTDGSSFVENVQKAAVTKKANIFCINQSPLPNDEICLEFDRLANTSSLQESMDGLDILKGHCRDSLQEYKDIITDLEDLIRQSQDETEVTSLQNCDDIQVISKRMNQHILLMKRAFDKEEEVLSEALTTDQSTLICDNISEIEDYWNKLFNLKTNHIEKVIKQSNEEHAIVETIQFKHLEKRKQIRQDLKSELGVLKLELEKVKSRCSLNSQKLTYLCRVLKLREEEGQLLKAEHLKTLVRMNSNRSRLQAALNEVRRRNEEEEKQLTKDVNDLRKSLTEAEERYWTLRQQEFRKFYDLWKMLDKEATDKVLQVESIQHQLQTTILGKGGRKETLRQSLPSVQNFGEDIVTDINEYWSDFSNKINENVSHFWGLLEIALQKYIGLKEERANLEVEVQLLLAENQKLKETLCSKRL